MPVAINNKLFVPGSVKTRLDAFRKTIKDGEGYTLKELSDMTSISASANRIREILCDMKWSIKQWNDAKRNSEHLLVNPKTLLEHAKQNKQ